MIPIAAVVAAATAAGIAWEHRRGVAAARLARRLLSGILWLALPPIAFFNLAATELDGELGAGIGFAYAGLAASLACAWIVARRVLRLPRPSAGSLMLVATFANTGYLGLPICVAAFGFDALPDAVAYDVLVSGMAVITVGFSIGAAFGTRGERPRERVRAFLVRNPPLWASLAGLAAPAALAPAPLVDASQLLAVAILVPAFFAIGITLGTEAEQGALRFPPRLTAPVAWGVAIKLLVAPAVVLLLAATVAEVPESYPVQAAMASAISNALVANEYGLDRGLAAGAIVWSTAIVVVAGLALAPPGL